MKDWRSGGKKARSAAAFNKTYIRATELIWPIRNTCVPSLYQALGLIPFSLKNPCFSVACSIKIQTSFYSNPLLTWPALLPPHPNHPILISGLSIFWLQSCVSQSPPCYLLAVLASGKFYTAFWTRKLVRLQFFRKIFPRHFTPPHCHHRS